MSLRNPFSFILLAFSLISWGMADTTSRELFDDGWSCDLNDGRDAGSYTKSFDVPESAANRMIYLDFDSLRSRAKVFINGRLAGEWGHGYSSFRVDATPHLAFGSKNEIVVQLDERAKSEGAAPGVGESIWLIDAPKVHIAHWGTYVTTPEVTDQQATVEVETMIDNNSGKDVRVVVRSEILDHGDRVAVEYSHLHVKRAGTLRAQLEVIDPKRWDPQNQHLYTLRTTLIIGGKVVDQKDTRFGIRRTEWEA